MSTATSSWGNATDLLATSGVDEDVSYYRDFTGPDEKAALTVPMRIQAAWARNDADFFADTFTENGSLLMQDKQLTSREEIREYMSKGFSGPLRGARVKGWPIDMRFLDENTALVVTEGGIMMAGDDDIQQDRLIRAAWVITREADGRLRLVSHQSSPVKG